MKKNTLINSLVAVAILGLLFYTMNAFYQRGRLDGMKEGIIVFQAILDQENQKLNQSPDSLEFTQLDSAILNHSEIKDTVPPLLFNVQAYE